MKVLNPNQIAYVSGGQCPAEEKSSSNLDFSSAKLSQSQVSQVAAMALQAIVVTAASKRVAKESGSSAPVALGIVGYGIGHMFTNLLYGGA